MCVCDTISLVSAVSLVSVTMMHVQLHIQPAETTHTTNTKQPAQRRLVHAVVQHTAHNSNLK